MAKPVKKDASRHHAQKETHKLSNLEYGTLISIDEAIKNLHNAKTNLLAKIASEKWNYPPNHELEFLPIDYQKNEVTVIMRGQFKAASSDKGE